MIIRVGDEKREMRDEHLKKLKDFIINEETQRNHKEFALDVFTSCIANLPHKVMLYTALATLISFENEQFVTELCKKVVESLKESLV